MYLRIILFALLSLNAFAQTAENAAPIETSQTFGDYLVLYNAFPALTLPAAMAANYGIDRRDDNALINITVMKKDSAQAARISGTYTDLINVRPLEFREIREENSVGYIAQVHYNNRETLRFDVQVQPQLPAAAPAPIGSPFKISFTRKFFTEP